MQFEQKYEAKNMTTKQLNSLRAKQEDEQEEVIDELIVNVKNLKHGGKAINEELTEQEKLLQVRQGVCRLWTIRWTTTSITCRPPGADWPSCSSLAATAASSQ
jgi:hypothetical protein